MKNTQVIARLSDTPPSFVAELLRRAHQAGFDAPSKYGSKVIVTHDGNIAGKDVHRFMRLTDGDSMALSRPLADIMAPGEERRPPATVLAITYTALVRLDGFDIERLVIGHAHPHNNREPLTNVVNDLVEQILEQRPQLAIDTVQDMIDQGFHVKITHLPPQMDGLVAHEDGIVVRHRRLSGESFAAQDLEAFGSW